MTSLASPPRLDYLDAVRAFALLLGVVFHASLSFMPIYIGWAVMDVSTGAAVPGFVLVSHSFRMEVFFLIAGFFSHMTFHRKGARSFIQSRLIRIAIPLVVGWFVLRPLIVGSWVIGSASMRGEVNILEGLKVGFLSLSTLPQDLLVGTHLWFLYYLLLITAIVLLGRAFLRLVPKLYDGVFPHVDSMVVWMAQSRGSLFILAIPTAICLWFMNLWGMDTPDKSLVPHLPVLLVYGGCFILGWLLHRQPAMLEAFARLSWGRVVLCLVSIGVTLELSQYQTDIGHPYYAWIRGGFALSYALMMWTLVFLSIGLFKAVLDRPNAVVRYLADSSYWMYLVHLPLVIWLQIAVAEFSIHWSLKLIAVSVMTAGVSIVLYDLFVRSTWIGQTLNGRRKDRVLFRKWARKRMRMDPEGVRP